MTSEPSGDRARIRLSGRDYVILSIEDYERLTGLAKVAEMPALPEPDDDGNLPAIDYLRASIARNVVSERVKLKLTQRELARLAGVRVETLCRIETGKHTASTATIDRLDRALKRAASEGAARERKKATRRRRSAS
jgi:DNA-binding XRE family transcriptional regulator